MDEFESRVGQKSSLKGVERDAEVLSAELAALNQKLRDKYGQDLAVVTGRGGNSRDARATRD